MADSKEFTLFVLADQQSDNTPSEENKLLLNILGVKDENLIKASAIVYQNKVVKSGIQKTYSRTVGEDNLKYTISAQSMPTIEIDGINYTETGSFDIQIVAYSNSLDKVIDHIMMTIEPDGSITIDHK